MRDRAPQRIVWMLGASALLHVWFMHTAPQAGAPRVSTAAGAPITATLHPRPVYRTNVSDSDRLVAQMPPGAAPALQRLVTDTPAASPARSRAGESVPIPVAPAAQPAAVADAMVVAALNARSSAAPHDAPPTYYAARDLDVFPKAITALDLGLRANTAGKVRATVLIDESGAVNEVRSIDASVAEIERATRDLLLRARFTPASKDGRVVKAQLLVSLDYGALP